VLQIWTIRKALQRNPLLKVSILADALRGTRRNSSPSTADLIAPLVEDFGHERVEVRMYHTPRLRGFCKWLLPERLNEGFGVQHMKLYGVDDEIIISG
jgi:CDP-diacylglycerol--glycerol-3-phosphate 3-phosphatidyltransferase